jgi:hypothetical protein
MTDARTDALELQVKPQRTTMIWKSIRGRIGRLVESQARRAFIDESRMWTALWTGYPVYPPHAIHAASEHSQAAREWWSPGGGVAAPWSSRPRLRAAREEVVPTAGAAAAAERVSKEMR